MTTHADRREWAVAIHGGAGSISRDEPVANEKEIRAALEAALRAAGKVLSKGGSALDAVETAVVMLEDSP